MTTGFFGVEAEHTITVIAGDSETYVGGNNMSVTIGDTFLSTSGADVSLDLFGGADFVFGLDIDYTAGYVVDMGIGSGYECNDIDMVKASPSTLVLGDADLTLSGGKVSGVVLNPAGIAAAAPLITLAGAASVVITGTTAGVTISCGANVISVTPLGISIESALPVSVKASTFSITSASISLGGPVTATGTVVAPALTVDTATLGVALSDMLTVG